MKKHTVEPLHFGGSRTHECKDCGSRLIEDNKCLTCDSKNLQLIVPKGWEKANE